MATKYLRPMLNKSIGFDKLCAEVALVLTEKGYDIKATPAEFREFIKRATAVKPGQSPEDIAAQLISDAGDNFENTDLPGNVSSIISARGRSRTTGWHDQNAVSRPAGGQATVSGNDDSKTPDSWGRGYQNPTRVGSGWADSRFSGENYGDRTSGGSGEDKQPTAARYRTPSISVQGEENPNFVVSDSPGRSGNYGTSSRISTQKDFKPGDPRLTTKDVTKNPALAEKFKKQYEGFARSGRPAPFLPIWVSGAQSRLPQTNEQIAKSLAADEELAQRGHPGLSCDEAHLGFEHTAFEKSEEVRAVKAYSSRLEDEARQLDRLASDSMSPDARDYYQKRSLQKRAVAAQLRKAYTPRLTK